MTSRESRFDDRLAAALDDVPIPPGLGERLLAALAAPAAIDSEPRIADVGPRSTNVLRSRAPARRRLASAAALAATLLIGAASWWMFHPESSADEDFVSKATAWAEKIGDADWRPMKSVPRGFAAPAALGVKPGGWQSVTRLVGQRAVAFDVSSEPRGRAGRPRLRAVLLVIDAAAAGLPTGPPAEPQLKTGGRAFAAWQAKGQVCVLIVEGDERHYRRLIRSGGAPVA